MGDSPQTDQKKNLLKSPRRTLAKILEDAVTMERRLILEGPDNIRPDTRHVITEIAADHVVIQLLGDESLVMPFHSIVALKTAPNQLTLRYR